MSDHLMQLPVLLFAGMMLAFMAVLGWCAIEDGLRHRD